MKRSVYKDVIAKTHLDDLHLLTKLLPQELQNSLAPQSHEELLEIILDLGRSPQARYSHAALNLSNQPVAREDLNAVVSAVGEFGADNRAGIEGTLHRISAILNRRGEIIGLTLRVGRAVFGTIDLIRDLVESGKSLLLLGRPGVGKTTKLREVARVLADDFGKRVVVIDTSNEIAGDGDIPHPAIGSARRMMVPHPDRQHAVMIEAVENHMPEVIIIDEIGTATEAMAARTIAERGVQLIGTAHGNILENLVLNPTLSDLVGGVQTVTLSDEEARLRGTQKTVSERKAPPTFDVVVEIVARDEVVVHSDTAQAVDAILSGIQPKGVHRRGSTDTAAPALATESDSARERPHQALLVRSDQRPVRIYAYALSRDSVERVIRDLHLDARTVKYPDQADLVISLRAREDDPSLQRIVQAARVPVHAVKKNSTAQIRQLLRGLFNIAPGDNQDEVGDMVRETERAVRQVKAEGVVAELAPRSAALRQMQHRIVTRHGLVAESIGLEPHRHLVIYPV
ncbi:R3H domain-containing nucleic acid-binding protein [Methylocaldum sp.]|uniref:R3H domain-containing nucleic acid-binding protein n=1 Tax=Methylocaldum sp. TaxID=1969727 RepID=UPI002D41E021|nr:R3H domain-containing nucleic acid-binding protein [Methylocaldum sp.]HYE35892.1 R3H domain-containing nucleic acid-binding protein [Methylocaldum sp.]